MPKDNDQNDQDKEGRHGEHEGMPKPAPKPGHYPPQKIEHSEGRPEKPEHSPSAHEKS
jgi:hypothetical protein